jgi:hypothetical protein
MSENAKTEERVYRTKAGKREMTKCEKRMRANANRYDAMVAYLKVKLAERKWKFNKVGLKRYAQEVAKELKVKVDREAIRRKKCLICWFCEHVEVVWPFFATAIEGGNLWKIPEESDGACD